MTSSAPCAWADASHPGQRPGRQMGVIAQELREVFPDLVREGPDGYLAVD
jgi:Chaperone of endosialidase